MDVAGSTELTELRVGVALSQVGRVTLRPTVRATGPTQGRLRAFCDALSLATDMKVSSMSCEAYADLLAELHWGTLHLAWLPPMIALRAVARGSALPVVAPVRGDSAWYWSALFTRDDGAIRDIADLKHARVAWVDHMSSAGYLVIRASLRAQGVDLGTAFGAESFEGTHDAVTQAVLEGRADVGATFAHFDDAGRVRDAGWGKNPVHVLKFAGPIPGDVLAASLQLPADVARAVSDALTGPGHDELKRAAGSLFNASGFEAVKREHLQHLEELLSYVEVPASP